MALGLWVRWLPVPRTDIAPVSAACGNGLTVRGGANVAVLGLMLRPGAQTGAGFVCEGAWGEFNKCAPVGNPLIALRPGSKALPFLTGLCELLGDIVRA
eukprot:CAMPEP_0178453102 /NCGR_PEP_ID=MMETSP0689_2-20121128/44618_1 /TAXON_ID=160604 /ORGANISM="Amphidinium massartii, Strain CS-259" /LENGTH=98 /DNA_ID=CAMNT_0020078891 /DNA_START=348 /DNA_END=644 /DNA_ORIENTATION=+